MKNEKKKKNGPTFGQASEERAAQRGQASGATADAPHLRPVMQTALGFHTFPGLLANTWVR